MAPRYAFELSGEHPTIPRSEALALLAITSPGYRVVSEGERHFVVEARDLDLSLDRLGARMAMTHRIVEVAAEAEPTPEGVAEAAAELDLPDRSYRVRAKRLGGAPLASDEVERMVGSVLWRRGYHADLADPQIEIRAVVTSERVLLGREVARSDRTGFRDRRPHKKPFFHPGAILPKLARALVNLSQVKEGERLLDPFAGTAGLMTRILGT
jgi:tRNA (guanine10-N2)-dimethyltransferase